MYVFMYIHMNIKQNYLVLRSCLSEKKLVNLLNFLLNNSIIWGTNKKFSAFTDSREPGTQAYTNKNPPQHHRHCTARIYVF